MPEDAHKSLAIACSVGGFKGVFVHGVLSALETAGIHADAYATASSSSDADRCLTSDNIDAVIYASTRMLHAWTIPAWIAGQAYVDAFYTCTCPALEMARQGYRQVIAIATEPGVLYQDMFQREPIPDVWQGVPIHIVRPDIDLATMGTDFTDVTEEGLVAVI